MVSHCIEERTVFVDDDQLNPKPDEEEEQGKAQQVMIGGEKTDGAQRNKRRIKEVFGDGLQTEEMGGKPFVELSGIEVFRLQGSPCEEVVHTVRFRHAVGGKQHAGIFLSGNFVDIQIVFTTLNM